MLVGHLKQKARPVLVFFVFSCILITTGLLFVMQKSEEKAYTFNSIARNVGYYPD